MISPCVRIVVGWSSEGTKSPDCPFVFLFPEGPKALEGRPPRGAKLSHMDLQCIQWGEIVWL